MTAAPIQGDGFGLGETGFSAADPARQVVVIVRGDHDFALRVWFAERIGDFSARDSWCSEVLPCFNQNASCSAPGTARKSRIASWAAWEPDHVRLPARCSLASVVASRRLGLRPIARLFKK